MVRIKQRYILGELLLGKKVKNNDLALFKDRVLFNGDSSYPLSPKTKLTTKSGFVEKEAHVSQNDMLKKIYSWHKIMEQDID